MQGIGRCVPGACLEMGKGRIKKSESTVQEGVCFHTHLPAVSEFILEKEKKEGKE